MIIRIATFVKSASKFQECPELGVPEFALIGRSNVWKSSLINMLVDRNSLVKVSAKPWKTKLMNFFLINDKRCLVDLPWYGYASAAFKDRWTWIDTTQQYFFERPTLKRLFVLIDGNIPPQKLDISFIKTISKERLPFDVIITKMDKMKQNEINSTLVTWKSLLKKITNKMPEIFFSSSSKKKWRDEILEYINTMI